MKSHFSLLIAALLFSSCHTESDLPESSIRIGIESEPITMDPHGHDDGITRTVQSNIYEGLVAFDANLRIVPALAERWDNPDSFTWRFFLRRNVSFHNGKPLKDSDVLYSLQHALKDPHSQLRSKLAGVENVTIRSPNVIDIRTRFSDPVLLNKLTSIFIVPEGSLDAAKQFYGTGPYVLESWKKTGPVFLRRFAKHWNAEATIDKVTFIPMLDASRRIDQLLNGHVQLQSGLPLDSIPDVKNHANTKVLTASGTTIAYLGFRHGGKNTLFDDLRFRRAIYLGIDANDLIREVFHGLGNVPTQPVPVPIFGYNPKLPKKTYDPELAKKLLSEISLPQDTELVLEMPENAQKRIGLILGTSFQNLGLRVKIVSYPWKDFYTRLMEGKLSFYLAGWNCESGDASDFLDSCIHSRTTGFGDCNVGNYSNPVMDQLIEKSHSVLVSKDRRALLQEIMRQVMLDLPVIPLYFEDQFYGASRDVEWTPRPDQHILVRDIRLRH